MHSKTLLLCVASLLTVNVAAAPTPLDLGPISPVFVRGDDAVERDVSTLTQDMKREAAPSEEKREPGNVVVSGTFKNGKREPEPGNVVVSGTFKNGKREPEPGNVVVSGTFKNGKREPQDTGDFEE